MPKICTRSPVPSVRRTSIVAGSTIALTAPRCANGPPANAAGARRHAPTIRASGDALSIHAVTSAERAGATKPETSDPARVTASPGAAPPAGARAARPRAPPSSQRGASTATTDEIASGGTPSEGLPGPRRRARAGRRDGRQRLEARRTALRVEDAAERGGPATAANGTARRSASKAKPCAPRESATPRRRRAGPEAAASHEPIASRPGRTVLYARGVRDERERWHR